MSRSYYKTPIRGNTTCRSERQDKRIWHKRWRKKERNKLVSLNQEHLDNHITIESREVSNPWSMGKDGKHYFSKESQQFTAARISKLRGRNPQERSAIKQRLLRQWSGK